MDNARGHLWSIAEIVQVIYEPIKVYIRTLVILELDVPFSF